MKFQNPSLNFFFERTDGRTHACTHARTSRKQYAPYFFKVGGIKIVTVYSAIYGRKPDVMSKVVSDWST